MKKSWPHFSVQYSQFYKNVTVSIKVKKFAAISSISLFYCTAYYLLLLATHILQCHLCDFSNLSLFHDYYLLSFVLTCILNYFYLFISIFLPPGELAGKLMRVAEIGEVEKLCSAISSFCESDTHLLNEDMKVCPQ